MILRRPIKTRTKYHKKSQSYGTYELSDIFPYRTYIVVENDTFESISDKLGVSVAEIRYLNDLSIDITDSDLSPGAVS